MSYYIVCQKKRNNPRMDIRICQKKCELKNECKEYLSLQKIAFQEKETLLSTESEPIQMELIPNTAEL
jgi:hypothetical protein